MMELINLPKNLKSIGKGAFNTCGWLRSITIPDSVTDLGSHAFYDCGALTSVSIPSSLVDKIKEKTFYKCDKLRYVTVRHPDGKEEQVSIKDEWR
jgi:hypothetical protein